MASEPVISFSDKAINDIAYIRQTLSSNTTFTSISGLAIIMIGIIALILSVVSLSIVNPLSWIAFWLIASVICFTIGLAGMYFKHQRDSRSLNLPLEKRFFFSLFPAWTVGFIMTLGMYYHLAELDIDGFKQFLVATWLLSYGTGVINGSLVSIKEVRLFGLATIILGGISFALPTHIQHLPEIMLALGFGLGHLIFGIIIWRYHDG